MTRKDYESLARALRDAGTTSGDRRGVLHAAKQIARALYEDNPRFDRKRFLAACGLGVKAGE